MLKKSIFITLLINVFAFGGTIVDDVLNYSIYLPDNWTKEVVSPDHHRFYDTTYAHKSYLTLVQYDLSNQTIYKSPHEWARANFLAYLISISCTMSPEGEALSDPFGATLYYDSSSVKQNDSLWAAELYSIFFSSDISLRSWAEFIRYTGVGNYGYELYAIGDTADMGANLGYYAAIISGIILDPPALSIRP